MLLRHQFIDMAVPIKQLCILFTIFTFFVCKSMEQELSPHASSPEEISVENSSYAMELEEDMDRSSAHACCNPMSSCEFGAMLSCVATTLIAVLVVIIIWGKSPATNYYTH